MTESTTLRYAGDHIEVRWFRRVLHYRARRAVNPHMFPLPMLREMLGRKYFVRICPPIEYETELLTAHSLSALY